MTHADDVKLIEEWELIAKSGDDHVGRMCVLARAGLDAVPRELTPEMIEAGWSVTVWPDGTDATIRKHYLPALWRAMWDAAPTVAPPFDPMPYPIPQVEQARSEVASSWPPSTVAPGRANFAGFAPAPSPDVAEVIAELCDPPNAECAAWSTRAKAVAALRALAAALLTLAGERDELRKERGYDLAVRRGRERDEAVAALAAAKALTDEQIIDIRKTVSGGRYGNKNIDHRQPFADSIAFARAILEAATAARKP